MPLRFTVHDTVDSTNTLLKQYAEAGEPEGLVCIANRQTMGKGRVGTYLLFPAGYGCLYESASAAQAVDAGCAADYDGGGGCGSPCG